MNEFTPQPSCADPYESNSLSVDQAQQRISNLVSQAVTSWQQCPLRDGLGRILHDDIVSTINVPPHDNSAMDGYAIIGSDITGDVFTLTQVGGRFLLGQPYLGKVNRGECIRIMTGAMMPADCDTVVMQEQTKVDNIAITFHGEQLQGQNVRHAGEDLRTGDTVLNKGHKITPADLGLIASLGIGEVIVKRKLRVAFFSTGDELRSIGDTLVPGQIYDSNRYTLYGMLKLLNVDILDMGVVADNKENFTQRIAISR